jgi:hypothetical protein
MALFNTIRARSRMIAGALIIAFVPVAAHAALLDPSFEIKGGALPVQGYCYDGFVAGGHPACAPGAWGGTSGVIQSGNGDWGGTTAADGNYYGFVQGTSVLSQLFTADASSHYSLSWFDAARTNNGGPQTYSVTIAGPSGNIFLGNFTTTGSGFIQRTAGPDFVLQGGSQYTLTFTGLVAQDVTSFIDNVQLAAVPEPASWLMMFSGFALLGAALRRRSQGALGLA